MGSRSAIFLTIQKACKTTRPEALASGHDQCGHHDKKRDRRVAKGMSGGGDRD